MPSIDIQNQRRNPRLEEFVRNKLNLVLGRFERRISKIKIQLGEEGKGKTHCTVDIRLAPRGTVHVNVADQNMYTAIGDALHRAERAVAKSIQKSQRGRELRHQRGGVRHDTERKVNAIAKSQELIMADDALESAESFALI